jgi:hypothetical protein
MPADPANQIPEEARAELVTLQARVEHTLRVSAPGALHPRRELVAEATGSPLGPAAFLAGLAA